ncbi:MAG TPA: hypothetical protein VFW07_25035 [Parafilimonas sp.]|nr:hypothetical protein [Parafilimonas sp.]
MKKVIVLFIAFIQTGFIVKAQQAGNVSSLIEVVKQIHRAYTDKNNLSFNVLYTYAEEASPGKILDSVFAEMQISNDRYHFTIGPTQTIGDSQYAVMLFSEDKVMYITKSSSVNYSDPIASLDSALLSMKGLSVSIEKQSKLKLVTINFPDSNRYKNIRLLIDNNTGFITQARFLVKAGALPGNNDFEIKGSGIQGKYAIIKADYTNYSTGTISDTVFDKTKYLTRDNKNFSTTPEYKDYKIFIGSPNL